MKLVKVEPSALNFHSTIKIRYLTKLIIHVHFSLIIKELQRDMKIERLRLNFHNGKNNKKLNFRKIIFFFFGEAILHASTTFL